MPTANAPVYQTLNDIFLQVVDGDSPDVVRMQAKDGSWTVIGAAELYARVRALALALARMGLRRGDRVALISENRWEWAVADFATLASGLVNVPLFPTLQAPQIGELLAHSGARVAIVSTAAQLKKVLAIRAQAALEQIVVMDTDVADDAGAVSLASLLDDSGYNVLISGRRADGAPREIVLSTKEAAPATPAASAPTQAAVDEEEESNEPPPREQQPAFFGPVSPGSPGTGAPAQPAGQGQVKTPQQMLEELQRLRQGQAAQQPSPR